MVISNEVIERLSILSKLELSKQEKEVIKEDLGKMIGYFGKLEELDTEQIAPLSHIFSMQNVFREDIVENKNIKEKILENAPDRTEEYFKVPNTLR